MYVPVVFTLYETSVLVHGQESDYQTCAVLWVMEALVPILRVFAKQGGMNREETEANWTVCLLLDSDVVRKYQASHLYSSLQS